MPPTTEVQAPKDHIISARLRAMAEACLYLDHSNQGFTKLEQYLTEAMKLHPEAVETYLLMAKAYDLLKTRDKGARAELNKKIVEVLNLALEYDFKNTEARLMLANVFIENRNPSLAGEYLKDILETRFDSATLEQAGNCHFETGNVFAAINCYSMGLSLQPRNHGIHTYLGFCLYQEGDGLKAYAEALRALILKPDFAPALTLKKEAARFNAKSGGSSSKAFEEMFAKDHLEGYKKTIFSAPFENDPLTGFATQSSLQLWVEQTPIHDIWAVAVHIPDLRVIALTKPGSEVNEQLAKLAQAVRDAFPEAVFRARPRADKLVIFLTSEPAPAAEIKETLAGGWLEGPLQIGVGKGSVALESLARAVALALMVERQ